MAGKRELIDTGTDKRYVRRNEKGEFKESDDVGRSLRQDVKQKAKTIVKAGYGDKGIRNGSDGELVSCRIFQSRHLFDPCRNPLTT
jgi:hypothetical protein